MGNRGLIHVPTPPLTTFVLPHSNNFIILIMLHAYIVKKTTLNVKLHRLKLSIHVVKGNRGYDWPLSG